MYALESLIGTLMNYNQFNKFCGSLVATTYVTQWGESHVWKVGGKLFAIGGWSENKQPAFVF
jgi:predicted DNA-binding protein (MmcQ/YjbR family)